VRDWSGDIDAEAEAGGGDERAPVSGGAARWLAAEAREVVVARHRSREEEIVAWGGGRISAGGSGVPFLKGAGGRRNRRGGWAMWPMRGGSGARAGRSLSTSERRPTGSGPKSAGACDVHRARAAGRTEGEGRG
jgi:hypothetical protein